MWGWDSLIIRNKLASLFKTLVVKHLPMEESEPHNRPLNNFNILYETIKLKKEDKDVLLSYRRYNDDTAK